VRVCLYVSVYVSIRLQCGWSHATVQYYNHSFEFLHILPVLQAKSVTAFSRPSTRTGVSEDFYLLVAGNSSLGGEPQSESALLRWETSVSSASLVLFQGFARVRTIYTKAAQRWAVYKNGSHTLAAVATAGHYQGTLANPAPKLSQCDNSLCYKNEARESAVSTQGGYENDAPSLGAVAAMTCRSGHCFAFAFALSCFPVARNADRCAGALQ
jgi:hypothetical protein